MRLSDGSYATGCALRLPESFSKENADLMQDPAGFRKMLAERYFGNWPELLKGLLTNGNEIRPWPLYFMPTGALAWATVPGVALVGDAAHLT